jgi:uncharacterized lipoprotein (TIGR02269 family)
MKRIFHLSALLLPIAAVLLAACGTTSPATRAWESAEQEEATSCDDPGADQCVALACDGEDGVCGVFGCEDVDLEAAARASLSPGVELARARPPMRGPGLFSHWRRVGLRNGAQPRASFHFRYRQGFLPAFPRYTGKVVKHHLFPQAKEFKAWFRRAGLDIHQYTLVIPEHLHLQIHRGDGRGGLWNTAWRAYKDAHPNPPSAHAILRHAFELAFRFKLVGPLVPYGHPVVPIGPQLFSN